MDEQPIKSTTPTPAPTTPDKPADISPEQLLQSVNMQYGRVDDTIRKRRLSIIIALAFMVALAIISSIMLSSLQHRTTVKPTIHYCSPLKDDFTNPCTQKSTTP